MTALIGVPNAIHEVFIDEVTRTWRSLLPCVVATDRNLEDLAHSFHRKLLPMLFDELIDHLGSLEKMLMAFFVCLLHKSGAGSHPVALARWSE